MCADHAVCVLILVFMCQLNSVPFEEDDKDPSIWFLDHSYLENMFRMFKKVNGESPLIVLSGHGVAAETAAAEQSQDQVHQQEGLHRVQVPSLPSAGQRAAKCVQRLSACLAYTHCLSTCPVLPPSYSARACRWLVQHGPSPAGGRPQHPPAHDQLCAHARAGHLRG
jgi:hypothetical protein